ncbi:MAG: hypothetical protein M0Z36_04345 [Thermaerobacter sp.]|nr:hypothetical protein [Thermaerobacter sp.]
MGFSPLGIRKSVFDWLEQNDSNHPAIHMLIRVSLAVSWIFLIGGVVFGFVSFLVGLVGGHGFLNFLWMLATWAFSVFLWIRFRVIPEFLQTVGQIEAHLHVLRDHRESLQ